MYKIQKMPFLLKNLEYKFSWYSKLVHQMMNEYQFPLKSPLHIISIYDRLKERQQQEEENRKQRIQLYVFVLRSIAYPFNAKQPGDMTKRHIKITKEGLEKLRARVEV